MTAGGGGGGGGVGGALLTLPVGSTQQSLPRVNY